jgi:hypothetical protein
VPEQSNSKLTFIFWRLNPKVAADGQGYFHFKCPSLDLSWDSISPFVHKELHLPVHERPVWPVEVESESKVSSSPATPQHGRQSYI